MNKYRVESIRLMKYDYTRPGAYFVTICTKNHRCLFGHLSNENSNPPKIVLSPEGRIIHDCWNDLPSHYINIRLDEFIIMPDHFHGIIIINRTKENGRKHGLPEFIRAFKSFASRRINDLQGSHESIWQPGYHDHVIQTDNELDRIRDYIKNNPLEWIKRCPG